MRCPHCGYISFDGLTACRRCAKPLLPRRGYVPLNLAPPSGPIPPSTAAPPTVSRPSLVYADLFRRGLAVLIDTPLLFFLAVLAMVLASLTAIGGGTLAGNVTTEVTLLAFGAAFLAAFAVSLAFHVLCWVWGGQTPGKMLMGLQVVREDGNGIGYGRALLRWVGYLCAVLPLGLGFVVAFFHPRGRGLHDLLAGTCVTRTDSRTT
ncbi:MAG: RDD family protein [Candidatus Methylomirabilales bacterium]